MFITAFPVMRLRYLADPRGGDRFSGKFGQGRVFYYYRGANAIWALVKALNLKPDEHILAPAYNCGIEVEAILEAGARVKYYGVKESLMVDLEDIRRKIDKNTRGLFIIHYFGFPQPVAEIKKICQERNLFLIEDCAHALFSKYNGEELGRFGDFAVFSFKKSLPVPDGGALLVNKNVNDEEMPPRADFASAFSVAREVLLSLINNLKLFHPYYYMPIKVLFIWPIKLLFRLVKALPISAFKVTTSDSMDLDLNIKHLGISGVSKKVISNADFVSIVNKRRENFSFLLEALKGNKQIRPIFSDLPEGICPLFFPVAVENRDYWQERLLRRGIETFIFGKFYNPALPAGEFPFAEYYSGHNLGLPVHQDLEERHIRYMVEAIREEAATR